MKRSYALTALVAAVGLLGLAAPASAARHTVDSVHSATLFKVKHFNAGNFYGQFLSMNGAFDWDASKPSAANISISVKTASVFTGNRKRDEHLKGPDFFNAKQFPELSFQSTKVTSLGGKKYKVDGKLSLHGVTRAVTATFVHTGTGKGMKGEVREGFEATLKIKRSDYGMKFMLGAIGDEVAITIAIEGIRQ